MTLQPKTFVTQPIDIDPETFTHLIGQIGSPVRFNEKEMMFDISAYDLEALVMLLEKRPQWEWGAPFYTQLKELVPNLRKADAYRFVAPRDGIEREDMNGVAF